MKKQCFLIVSLILLIATSCEKDENNLGGGPSPAELNSNCKLSSIVFFNELDSIYRSTTEIVYYPNSNIAHKFLSYSNGQLDDSVLFVYDSNNRLKYVLERRYNSTFLDTIWQYTYNSLGNLVHAKSCYYNNPCSEFDFNYSSNSQLPSSYLATYNHSPSELIQLNWLNGNLVQLLLKEIDGLPTNPNPVLNIVYDNSSNPIKGLYSPDLLIWEMFSNNNPTRLELIQDGETTVQNNTLSYSNGRLSRKRIQFDQDQSEITLYNYTCD